MNRALVALVISSHVAAGCTETHGIMLGDARDPDISTSDPVEEPALDPDPDPEDPYPDFTDILEEPAWPCTPEFADQRRTILGGLSVSVGGEDDPDRPDLVTLDTGEVWVVGRIVNSPYATDTPKLTYVIVNPTNALPGGSWYHPLTSLELDAYHPTVPVGDPAMDPSRAMVTVLPDVADIAYHQMMFLPLGAPPTVGAPTPFYGTDILSTQPAAASNGSDVMAVWRQGDDTATGTTINYGIADDSGTVVSTGIVAGAGVEPLHSPVVAHASDRYGVAYCNDASSELAFLEIAEDGDRIPGSDFHGSYGGRLKGRPAMAWNGSRYGIVFEAGAGSTSTVWFCLKGSGAGSMACDDLTSILESTVGTITDAQEGMLDIAWNGQRFGVVWVHSNPVTDREVVWFFELDEEGAVVNGPHGLNPDAARSYNPAITWVARDWGHYYVFAWDEFSSASGVHVLYTYSYGCSL